MMGGTFMRQHNFIFDVDNGRLGIAHAACNHDPNQITSTAQMSSRKYWVKSELECTHQSLYALEYVEEIIKSGGSTLMVILEFIFIVVGCIFAFCCY